MSSMRYLGPLLETNIKSFNWVLKQYSFNTWSACKNLMTQ